MEIILGFMAVIVGVVLWLFPPEPLRRLLRIKSEAQFSNQNLEELPNRDAVTASTTSGVLAKIKSTERLRIGCLWYPPFVEYEIQGGTVEASGFYPDILTALAESRGWNIRFTILKWHEAIDAINCGEVDIVACVLKSAERRASCDFAGTVFRVGVGAVTKQAQAKIIDHGDLSKDDVLIAVTKGEIGWTYAAENLELAQNPVRFTVLEDANIQTMMLLVASGKVDCALADSLSCAQFIESTNGKKPKLTDVFAMNPIHVEDNSLMIAKGNHDLREWLNTEISALCTNPSIIQREKEIELKYPNILRRAKVRE